MKTKETLYADSGYFQRYLIELSWKKIQQKLLIIHDTSKYVLTTWTFKTAIWHVRTQKFGFYAVLISFTWVRTSGTTQSSLFKTCLVAVFYIEKTRQYDHAQARIRTRDHCVMWEFSNHYTTPISNKIITMKVVMLSVASKFNFLCFADNQQNLFHDKTVLISF